MYAIGIDLGTTNSVVSVYKNGRTESLKIDGRYFVPSVVSFRKDQPRLVGQAAKARMEVDPESTVASAKRFMGDQGKKYPIHGKEYTPVDIAAIVLQHVVEKSKQALGHDIYDAIITVPAYFNDDQRADTRRAGEQAGLNVLRLISEPSSAAICYGFEKSKDQTIMVYDFGGGTFDISVLKVIGNKFHVIGVGGDSRLGGDDIDHLLVDWIAKAYADKFNIDLLDNDKKEYAMARQRLKEAAEKAKIELSSSPTTDIYLPELAGHSLDLELDVEQFNRLIEPILKRTVECMQQVLRETDLSGDDIDRVVLVGGSTKIPAVKGLVDKEIREPYSDINPDEAVAWGAAIVAASYTLPDVDLAPSIEYEDVTAHSLGIGLLDEQNRYMFQPLIIKNSRYPCKGGIIGYTIRPFQTEVAIRVFRGEEPVAEDNTKKGELIVPVLKPSQIDVPVVAVLRLDEDGILTCDGVTLEAQPAGTVDQFLTRARNNNGAIDIDQFDKLVESSKIDEPKQIEIRNVFDGGR